MTVKMRVEREEKKEKEERFAEMKTRIRWDDEARTFYKEKTERAEWIKNLSNEPTKEIWRKLKEMIQEAMVKKEVGWKRKEIGHKEWWDRERKGNRTLRERKGRCIGL